MSTAIYNTEVTPDPGDYQPTNLTVNDLCRMLLLGPAAVPLLAERGDLTLSLPPVRLGYCPALGDVRIVRIRTNLNTDTKLLAELRVDHPADKRDSHLHRMTALGGILRLLGR